MNRREFITSFVERHNWNTLPNERDDFAVSPDQGEFKRVFFADLTMRKAGTMLFGVIGITIILPPKFLKSSVELSAYITNFDIFSGPPIIVDKTSLDYWVDKIVSAVYLLPDSAKKTKLQANEGIIGAFPLKTFMDSSPDSDIFLKYINGFQ